MKACSWKGLIFMGLLCISHFSSAGSFDDFFLAVQKNDSGAITALLNRGFDGNTLSARGEHGLLIAVRESSLSVIESLLQWPKINVEVRSLQGESPLMLAALNGQLEVCEKLILKGADVNKPGWAPLHYAATHGHLKVMQLLLDNHAYIDAASPNGTTPLMMAAHYGTPDAVKLLLDAGADPMLKNDKNLSAVDFAKSATRADSAEFIAVAIRRLQPKGTW